MLHSVRFSSLRRTLAAPACKIFHGLAITGLLLIPARSHAALSGFFDSAEQIATIMADNNVANATRQSHVNSLTFNGAQPDHTLKWTLQTATCAIQVYLTPVPPQGGIAGVPMVGKTTYDVQHVSHCP